MIHLAEITEQNWLDVAKLRVTPEQQDYVANPVGILARGYVYRNCNARVMAITDESQIIGVALVRDFTDEPLGYDLQQFIVDAQFQNKGYGTEALKLILASLQEEARFDRVEVCVNREDAQALHVYEKVGFVDSGYIDPDVPNCFNLVYHFPRN